MDHELSAALEAQRKLLAQLAADVAIIKTIVVREAKPLTTEQQMASAAEARRKLMPKRS